MDWNYKNIKDWKKQIFKDGSFNIITYWDVYKAKGERDSRDIQKKYFQRKRNLHFKSTNGISKKVKNLPMAISSTAAWINLMFKNLLLFFFFQIKMWKSKLTPFLQTRTCLSWARIVRNDEALFSTCYQNPIFLWLNTPQKRKEWVIRKRT